MTAELDEDSGIRLLCVSDSDGGSRAGAAAGRASCVAGIRRSSIGRLAALTARAAARRNTHRNRQTGGRCGRISGCRRAVRSRRTIPSAGRRRTHVMVG